jgi:hypothetical protein
LNYGDRKIDSIAAAIPVRKLLAEGFIRGRIVA